MEKNKLIKVLPTNDLLFQHIFGKVGNEEITKDFLEKLLGIEIEGLTLDTNKRMQGERLEDKIGRVDVKAKLTDGTVVIIEMQVAPYQQMEKRLLYYWSKAYSEGINRGDAYSKLHKTISILITVENMEFTKGIDKYHTIWNLREKEKPEIKFSEDIEIHVIELKKFDKRTSESPEDNWIQFINSKREGDMEELKVDEVIRKAKEEFNMLVNDEEHYEEYQDRIDALRDQISFLTDARDRGLAEGREKGLEEGRAEGKTEGMAKGMAKGKIEGEKIR